ncbi:hypothetical protein AB2L28_05865 [Kineococcus sp. TBRC 1896]|uniref:Uncharacterized protein n=1 Tax=Kineococcus mangrovi TaxID=1660183 RepID=A0ABV4HZB9_9ACTN
MDGSTVHGDVHQGDDNRRYKVRIDRRTINRINAPVRIDVPQPVPAGPPPPPRPAENTSDDDAMGRVVVFALVGLLCVVGYIRYRDAVITVAMSAQLFAFSAAAMALLVARVRSVVYSTGVTTQLLLDLVMGAVALLGLRWLADPPFAGSVDVQAVFSGGQSLGAAQLFEQFGSTAVFFILYQLGGLLFSCLAMAFVVLHAIKVYLAAGAAVRAANDPSYVPGSFRRWMLRTGGTPSGCWSAAIFASLVGAVLVSGLGYELMEQLQSIGERWLPSTAPGA